MVATPFFFYINKTILPVIIIRIATVLGKIICRCKFSEIIGSGTFS